LTITSALERHCMMPPPFCIRFHNTLYTKLGSIPPGPLDSIILLPSALSLTSILSRQNYHEFSTYSHRSPSISHSIMGGEAYFDANWIKQIEHHSAHTYSNTINTRPIAKTPYTETAINQTLCRALNRGDTVAVRYLHKKWQMLHMNFIPTRGHKDGNFPWLSIAMSTHLIHYSIPSNPFGMSYSTTYGTTIEVLDLDHF